MDSSVERVNLLGVESSDHGSQIFINVVFEDVVLKFGGLLDVIVHFLKDLENEVKCFLVDILDGDLNRCLSYVGALLDGLSLFNVFHGSDLLLIEVVFLAVNDDYDH